MAKKISTRTPAYYFRARLRMQDTIDDMQQEGIKLRNVRRRLFHDDDSNTQDQQKLDPGVEDNTMNFFYEEIRQKREEVKIYHFI